MGLGFATCAARNERPCRLGHQGGKVVVVVVDGGSVVVVVVDVVVVGGGSVVVVVDVVVVVVGGGRVVVVVVVVVVGGGRVVVVDGGRVVVVVVWGGEVVVVGEAVVVVVDAGGPVVGGDGEVVVAPLVGVVEAAELVVVVPAVLGMSGPGGSVVRVVPGTAVVESGAPFVVVTLSGGAVITFPSTEASVARSVRAGGSSITGTAAAHAAPRVPAAARIEIHRRMRAMPLGPPVASKCGVTHLTPACTPIQDIPYRPGKNRQSGLRRGSSYGRGMRRWVIWVVVGSLAVTHACSGTGGMDLQSLRDEPVVGVEPGGTSGRRVLERGGRDPELSVLWDVDGDWVGVSVELAELVLDFGWTIESINCVGTGNDVIARKQTGETWILLEAGAGTRGAGMILSFPPDQAEPGRFDVRGACDDALVRAAQRR